MRPQASLILIGVCAVALGACALPGTELERVTEMDPGVPAFDHALYNEYLDQSKTAYDEGDYVASDFYADRARNAANHETVLPITFEAAQDWRNLSDENVQMMRPYRERLMAILDNGGRARLPEKTASAQAHFDCWVEESAENRQPDDIASCRQALMASLEEIETAMAPAPQPMTAAAPPPTPAPPPPAPPIVSDFLVFFDWDSATVPATAGDVLSQVVDNARRMGAASVQLVGHADTSGPTRYNEGLSMRRATAVEQALMEVGLKSPSYNVEARGESDPLVPTGDGVREPQNRRVRIVLVK